MEPSQNIETNSDVLTVLKNGMIHIHNPKCTVNNHFFYTQSVYIYIYYWDNFSLVVTF